MESGTEDLHPHRPSMEHPTDQPPVQQDSMEERGSDVEDKLSQEKGKTFSSQSVMGDVPQPYGGFEYPGNDPPEPYYCSSSWSEPKTDEEENSKENETQDRNSCTTLSDAERGSSPESSRKRKLNSRDGTCERTGASPDERSATLEKKKQKVLDSGHSRKSEEIRDARPRRSQRRRPGRSKRPRSRSPGDQPPPLRKSLLTALRSMSEAIYQNIVNVYNQKGYSPLLWEQLAQLRGPLCTAVLTTYAMANQAAYVFPAEGWLVPTPLSAPSSPAGDGGEGPCSKDSLPLP
ncbi:protein FRG2-like-1 [Delphinus delphis]|uniref:protein FRG2-like-1 n=1 Tax=Delphinus delphis TaxID=9728 RepID=UPI0037521619